jgi:hypothetical protein
MVRAKGTDTADTLVRTCRLQSATRSGSADHCLHQFKSPACLFEPPAAASDRIAQRGGAICSTTTFGAACGRIQYRQRGRLVYAEPLQASCAVVSDAGRCGVERVARRLERPRAAPCGMPASRRCGSFAFPPAHPPAPAHAPPVQALSSRKGTRTD